MAGLVDGLGDVQLSDCSLADSDLEALMEDDGRMSPAQELTAKQLNTIVNQKSPGAPPSRKRQGGDDGSVGTNGSRRRLFASPLDRELEDVVNKIREDAADGAAAEYRKKVQDLNEKLETQAKMIKTHEKNIVFLEDVCHRLLRACAPENESGGEPLQKRQCR